jgi:uncharacterized integral membrane protein (TIGR00698 family)
LSAALAALAMGLGGLEWLQSHGMSALTVAILLGIVLANTVYTRLAGTVGTGVDFSKQTLLRAGVILYGLRLTLQDIGHVGIAGVLIDAAVLTSTFALAYLLGTRFFGLDRTTAILIGAGSAICGAAAVMATEPIHRRCCRKACESRWSTWIHSFLRWRWRRWGSPHTSLQSAMPVSSPWCWEACSSSG